MHAPLFALCDEVFLSPYLILMLIWHMLMLWHLTGKMLYTGTVQTIKLLATQGGPLKLYNGFLPYYLRCGGHTVGQGQLCCSLYYLTVCGITGVE